MVEICVMVLHNGCNSGVPVLLHVLTGIHKILPTALSFIYFVSDQHFSRVPLGLWFDLEISYSGSFLMTLETKMNLIRLGKEGESVRFGETGKDG